MRRVARQSSEAAPGSPSEELTELAHRVRRLAPSHRDPHRFHEEKSEIEHVLMLMARRLGDG